MIDIGAIGILTLFLILDNLEAVTIVNHHPDDEYVLEHEVLREEALAEAKKLVIYPGEKINLFPFERFIPLTQQMRKLSRDIS